MLCPYGTCRSVRSRGARISFRLGAGNAIVTMYLHRDRDANKG